MELVLIISLIILLIIAIWFLRSPKTKGVMGEWFVKSSLGDDIPNEKYVINDLLLYHKGKSHQIDHIVIRKTGVFVIETKNYSGLIYGQVNQRNWTQVLAYGKVKNRFYNPLLQNRSHIYTLSKILGRNDCFISIIVFPKASIMTYIDAYVGSISDMKRWLKQDRKEILTAKEIEQIYAQLIDYKINPRITNSQHIESIYDLKRNLQNNICPRCGKELQLRKGKYGPFYGCSGYPHCKFIKK